VNNPTLTEFCFGMIGRADIEGSKSNVAMNAWLPQASSSVPPPRRAGGQRGSGRCCPWPALHLSVGSSPYLKPPGGATHGLPSVERRPRRRGAALRIASNGGLVTPGHCGRSARVSYVAPRLVPAASRGFPAPSRVAERPGGPPKGSGRRATRVRAARCRGPTRPRPVDRGLGLPNVVSLW
jgi:hypothetical protein